MKTNRLFTVGIYFLVLISFASACSKKKAMDENNVLAETDRFYSALSVEKGSNAAFLAMFDSSGVMLRSDHMPVEGHKAIEELLMRGNDSTYTLTWEPLFARIAKAGDMGYTYGTYQVRDKGADSISGEGTYVTIWQKKEDGSWKALLDTGNDGLGRKQ